MKRFACMNEPSWLGGVLSGLAYAIGFPTWVIRLVFFIAWISTTVDSYIGSSTLTLAYVLLWIFLPNWQETPADYTARTGDSS